MYAIGSSAAHGFGVTGTTVGAAAGTAALGPGVGTVVGGLIGGLITGGPSSATRAQKVMQAIVDSANSGNLLAVEVLDLKAHVLGMVAAERAIWIAGYNLVHPDVIADYQRFRSKLPNLNQPGTGLDTPESSAQVALSRVITAADLASAPGKLAAPMALDGMIGGVQPPAMADVGKLLFSPIGLLVAGGIAYLALSRK